MPIYEILTNEIQRVGARAPQNYKQHVADAQKRLNILFDLLNNQSLEPDTIDEIKEVAQQIQSRQHDAATALMKQIITSKTNQGSDWMVSYGWSSSLPQLMALGWCQQADPYEQSNTSIDSYEIKKRLHTRPSS